MKMKRQADSVDSTIPSKLPQIHTASNPEIPVQACPPPLFTERYKTPYVPSKYMANFDVPKLQDFSFPGPIIRYITFNPAKKSYATIVGTCKYFYSLNPIFLFWNLNYVKDATWTTCNPECSCSRNFKLFNIPSKIWIKDRLHIKDEPKADPNIASTFITKLHQCDVEELFLTNQNLTFKEFLFLTKCVTYLVLQNVAIRDDANGTTILSLEKIVESLTKLQKLYYSFNDEASDITSNTVKKLLEMSHIKDLKDFDLCQVPEIFDFKMFSGFMDKNKHIHFHLCFRPPVSIEYETQVEAYKEKIKNDKYEGVEPPTIIFL